MLFVILDLHSACIYGGGLSILKILVSELTRISGFVRLKGLEPPRREASDPKSDVATNYTTAALESCAKVMLFYKLANICVVFLAKPYFFSVSDKRWVIAASIIVSLPFLDIFLGHRNLICRIDTEFRMLFVYI